MEFIKTILIIDHSRFVLKYYSDELKNYGFNVITASDESAAIECIDNNRIDCILMSYELAPLPGPDFAHQLKTDPKYKKIPILILTSKEDKKYLLNAIRSGADDFIKKDLDTEIICAKINAVIRYGDLLEKQLEVERYRTVHAMMTTLSHEIINPLQIAYGMIGRHPDNITKYKHEKAVEALDRVNLVVKKIYDLTSVSIEFDKYTENSELIKIDKKKA